MRTWLAVFSVVLAALLAGPGAFVSDAFAQDPSSSGSTTGAKSFPKQSGGIFGKRQKVDQAQPLYLQGDQLVYDSQGNKVVAKGNVEIYYNNNILTADEVVYDQTAGTLTAAGNVLLKDPNGNIIRADRYTLSDDFRDGFIQSLAVVARDDTRIAAEQAVRRDGNVTEFQKGKFTPCRSEGGMPPLWCVSAAQIVHDTAAQTVTYQDAWFEIFGQPVFYLPYFQHADPSVKRKSGLLAPGVGFSDTLGYMYEQPYYFVLAPNADFTFNPAYYSNHGMMWQGEFRHRVELGQYSVKFAALNQDCADLKAAIKTLETCDDLDGWRGFVESHGKFSLSSWWSAGWDGIIESDDTFRRFYKFDSILLTDRVNKAYMTGLSDRNYFNATLYHFGGLLVDDKEHTESLVHPVVDYNYVLADPVLGGELSFNAHALSFSRDTSTDNRQEVTRVLSEVKWRRRMTDSLGISYTPFGELRGEVYQARDFIDPVTGQTVTEDTSVRGLATAGATVSYPWVATNTVASHIIEPIGQIITRQASIDQRRLPDEDARSLVFDDTNLFDTQKVSGYDRIETGTRANVGLQYTFQMNSGGHARLLAGQSFHLSGENIYAETPGFVNPLAPTPETLFNPRSGLETARSDYVLGAYIAPTDSFRLISQSRFDSDTLDLRREDLAVRLSYGPVLAQATYAYSAADPELNIATSQQDVTATVGLQLSDRWSVLGGIRYDIDANFRLMDSIQLRYADECFVLTATYRETFINDPTRDIEPDRTFMLRFELKHIGEFKYKTDINDFVFGEDQPPK